MKTIDSQGVLSLRSSEKGRIVSLRAFGPARSAGGDRGLKVSGAPESPELREALMGA